MELFELAMYKAMNGSGDGGGDELIVYIPEQTVTTQQYGRDTFYAELSDVNFDLDNLPDTIILTVDGTDYEMQQELDGYYPPAGVNAYCIRYGNIVENGWVIVDERSEASSGVQHTVYAEGSEEASEGIKNPKFHLVVLTGNAPQAYSGSFTEYALRDSVVTVTTENIYRGIKFYDGIFAPSYHPDAGGTPAYIDWRMEFENIVHPNDNYSITDLVNCDYDTQEDGTSTIIVFELLDPTQDAGATITIDGTR